MEWFRHDTRCPVCRYNLLRRISSQNRDASFNDVSNVSQRDISQNNYVENDISRNDLSFYNVELFTNARNIFDFSNNLLDLSNNIASFSNDLANNIMNAFQTLGKIFKTYLN